MPHFICPRPLTASTALALAMVSLAGLPVAGIVLAQPAAAQVSRPVVQALPSDAAERRNTALRNLARNAGSLPDLIDAGEASLELEDGEAALGFFLRAEAIQPGFAPATAGRGAALALLGRPVEALDAFALAERKGAVMAPFDGWHGLAWDLVGDNARAQQYYRAVLARGPDAAVTRRLALSLAISGDEAGMDEVLLPLLEAQDLSAFRTRAFSLAILGKPDDAMAIAEAILPRGMAAQLEPYLRSMQRLTRAQQAAAANLGQFPTAGRIGRDSPDIAAYSGQAVQVAVAVPANAGGSDRLTPAGEPLGRTPAAQNAASEPVEVARAEEPRRSERRNARRGRNRDEGLVVDGSSVVTTRTPIEEAPPTPVATTEPVARVAEPVAATAGELPATEVAVAQDQVAAPVDQVPAGELLAGVEPMDLPAAQVAEEPAFAAEPVIVARAETGPPVAIEGPSFSIRSEGADTAQAVPAVDPVDIPAQPAASSGQDDFGSGFAAFTLPPAAGPEATRPDVAAVDITTIRPARETQAPVESKQLPPAHPSRHWVQVATGRDVAALKFDWRRIKRSGGDTLADSKAFTVRWGETNRLVTGPYPTQAAANAAVAALKEGGLDSFRFTSAAGEEVAPLD